MGRVTRKWRPTLRRRLSTCEEQLLRFHQTFIAHSRPGLLHEPERHFRSSAKYASAFSVSSSGRGHRCKVV